MKHTSIFYALILAGLLGATASCSSSGGNATPPASIPAPVSGFASTSAVTSSLTASLGSIGGGGAALVKGQTADEEIDYACYSTDEYETITCNCPEGGSITSTLVFDDLGWTDCGDGTIDVVLTAAFVELYTDCAFEKCGEIITLNGLIGGPIEGSIDCDGNMDLTATVSTIDEEANSLTCSGITASPESADDVEVGFSATFTSVSDANGVIVEESFSGSFCTDPPGEPDGVIEFESEDELEASADPDGTCEAAETE